jgi:cyclophilin family peptidyl-prolyl cis-trans isomerase
MCSAARWLAAERLYLRSHAERGNELDVIPVSPTQGDLIVKRFLFLALGVVAAASMPSAAELQKNPTVVMDTSMGKITVELFADKAPGTVKNFLDYVDDKFYDGTVIHRVIPTFMVQGGGFEPGMKQKKTKDPIKNESANGLSNQRGTLAMARTSNPDSATSQFFINVADNKRLDRSEDDAGYCVFARVLDGMEVVDKIKAVKTGTKVQKGVEVGGKTIDVPHGNVPVEDIVIKSVRRAQ